MEENLKSVVDLICEISSEVPGGMLVFFTSYAVLTSFKLKVGKILDKRIFRDLIYDDEKALEQYEHSLKQGKIPPILFSVMGGKLSEGINFKDDMGSINLT